MSTAETIGKRLKALREQRKISQAALAKSIGWSTPSRISNYELGTRSVSADDALLIGKALSIPPSQLLFGETSNIEKPGTVDGWDNNTPLSDNEVEVPFLKDIELACGNGSCTDTDYNGFKLRFSKSTLKKVGVQKEHVFCFSARGDSMEPVIPDGCTVAINTEDKSIVDGKVYAINQDGWKRLKVLHRIGPDRIRISSFNTQEGYNPEEVRLSDVEIIGRMFWTSTLW